MHKWSVIPTIRVNQVKYRVNIIEHNFFLMNKHKLFKVCSQLSRKTTIASVYYNENVHVFSNYVIQAKHKC